ncbi:MAG: hypothetical protein VX777_09445 [Chlamydiota bacterium]|nr:hypothetical protein [Chlamydiota bacterium]
MTHKRYFSIVWALLMLTFLSPCDAAKSSGSHPRLVSINIIDRNGMSETISGRDRLAHFERVNFLNPQPYQKVMRIYNRMANGDVKAYITSYHANGQIKQFLAVVNNRAHGMYREWHENGSVRVDATVIGGSGDLGPSHENTWLFEGVCRAWDNDGRKEAEISYSKGFQEGISTYYHKNGKIWKKIPYKKGMIHGQEETFLDNGVLLQVVHYQDGVKHGEAKRYWKGRNIAAIEIFDNGKLDTGNYYDINGNHIAQITFGEGKRAIFGRDTLAELQQFHNGELDGKVEVFTENGDLFSTFHVKNGEKHGEEVEYYPRKKYQNTPHQKIAINWFEGNIQGLVKTWYTNGNQESQREMSKNVKNGLATAWYEDGNLMLIEEYDHDKLESGKYFKKGSKIPISQVKGGNGVVTINDSQGNYVKKINYHHGNPEV